MFFGESRFILSFNLIQIRFYPILRSASIIEIHFTGYVENIELFLSQKSQFDLVKKIKNKNTKRTRASLSRSSEDGKQEIFLCALSTIISALICRCEDAFRKCNSTHYTINHEMRTIVDLYIMLSVSGACINVLIYN